MNNGQKIKVTKGYLEGYLGHIVGKTFLGYDCIIRKTAKGPKTTKRFNPIRLTLTSSEFTVELTEREKERANLSRYMV